MILRHPSGNASGRGFSSQQTAPVLRKVQRCKNQYTDDPQDVCYRTSYVVYLTILEGSATSLILWRLTTVEGKVITSIYRMDFDIDNDEAKDRLIARSAEHALAKLDAATIANLLSNTP